MEKYKEVNGCLITLALSGVFDVVAHGCNCFCKQRAGLAPQMVAAFGTDKFFLEGNEYEGDFNKLGQINYQSGLVTGGKFEWAKSNNFFPGCLIVVNCYTQYKWGLELKPFDYEAFTLCMRKMNHQFKGKKIGLPAIGAGLAGGDIIRIKAIMKKEFTDCYVTLVLFTK